MTIRVIGKVETRTLGAWNVTPGVTEAFFGLKDPGPIQVTWALPGRKPVTRELVVEDKLVRLLIPSGAESGDAP